MNVILNSLKKTALIAVGTLSFVIGIAGLVLPLLPGTPFLILSSICFRLAN
jgi:uncharacterized membrane protein YbaN (DUF454 family)